MHVAQRFTVDSAGGTFTLQVIATTPGAHKFVALDQLTVLIIIGHDGPANIIPRVGVLEGGAIERAPQADDYAYRVLAEENASFRRNNLIVTPRGDSDLPQSPWRVVRMHDTSIPSHPPARPRAADTLCARIGKDWYQLATIDTPDANVHIAAATFAGSTLYVRTAPPLFQPPTTYACRKHGKIVRCRRWIGDEAPWPKQVENTQ